MLVLPRPQNFGTLSSHIHISLHVFAINTFKVYLRNIMCKCRLGQAPIFQTKFLFLETNLILLLIFNK